MTPPSDKAGSKAASGDPKSKPHQSKPQPKLPAAERVQVRHFKGISNWFIPNADYTGAVRRFHSGVMKDVIFNPSAREMADFICHSGRVSDADATGLLVLEGQVIPMPKEIKKKCLVAFDVEARCFHKKGDKSEVFDWADYLILYSNNQAEVGWFEEFPQLVRDHS